MLSLLVSITFAEAFLVSLILKKLTTVLNKNAINKPIPMKMNEYKVVCVASEMKPLIKYN